MYHITSWIALVLVLLGGSVAAQTETTTDSLPTPEATTKNISYAYGYNFGKDLAENDNFSEKERNSKYLLKGLKDALYKLDTAKLNRVTTYLLDRIDAGEPTTDEKVAQNTAYNLGYNALGNLVNLLELDKTAFHYGWLKKGYLDFVNQKEARYSSEQRMALLSQFFKEKQALVQERYERERKLLAEKNLKKAEAFLLENSKKAGIQTTASGLQYQIIKEGTGVQASINDRVKVHYTGTFADGQTFDSSIDRGEPAIFALNGVIKGWQEGIPLMKEGARYRFFIPPSLGYGASSPPSIQPNAVLIFDVELLQVVQTEDIFSTKGTLSYSYGYMLSSSLGSVGFSEAEREVGAFIEGYAAGFSVSKETFEQVEGFMRNRIQSQQAATTAPGAQEVAYNIGLVSSASIAKQFDARAEDFDLRAIAAGYKDAFMQTEPQFTEQEMNDAVNEYFEPKQQAAQQRRAAQDAALAAENKAAATAFLQENGQKPNIKTTESGLQYEVLQEGTGAQPTGSSTVTTHYTGKLLNGDVFDSSVERGEPASFRLNQVIQGWQEGIPLMKQGAKYRFYIPSDLGYGDRGVPGNIPPGALLIFEVELLDVKE